MKASIRNKVGYEILSAKASAFIEGNGEVKFIRCRRDERKIEGGEVEEGEGDTRAKKIVRDTTDMYRDVDVKGNGIAIDSSTTKSGKDEQKCGGKLRGGEEDVGDGMTKEKKKGVSS